jgi:predicted alpha/beta superfamily hydrolase
MNLKMKCFFLPVFILTISFITYAQKDVKSEGITWKIDTIHSAILKDDISLRIYLPDGYEKSQKKYPVLFISPNWQPEFPQAVGLVKFLSEVKKIPELIVISMGCNRWRDMLPSVSISHGTNTGHADSYLDFIEKELIPDLEKKYPAGSERIFWSHSIGGVFSLYALLSKPDIFQSVIASSPYYPYELSEEEVKKYGSESFNHEKSYIIKHMEEFLEKRTTQKNFLFLIIGNEPELMPYFDETIKILEKKQPRGLLWKSSKWLNENHQSMYSYALQAGLLAIYANREFK